MSPRWQCEHNCRQDKTVLSRPHRRCELWTSHKQQIGRQRIKVRWIFWLLWIDVQQCILVIAVKKRLSTHHSLRELKKKMVIDANYVRHFIRPPDVVVGGLQLCRDSIFLFVSDPQSSLNGTRLNSHMSHATCQELSHVQNFGCHISWIITAYKQTSVGPGPSLFCKLGDFFCLSFVFRVYVVFCFLFLVVSQCNRLPWNSRVWKPFMALSHTHCAVNN